MPPWACFRIAPPDFTSATNSFKSFAGKSFRATDDGWRMRGRCYHLVEHSSETARVNREEGGDDVKSSCPLCLGLHTCYNGKYKEMQYREVELNYKTCLSSDCRLKLAYMKLELLVIANQNVAVNTFPGLVHTARHTMRVGNTQSS